MENKRIIFLTGKLVMGFSLILIPLKVNLLICTSILFIGILIYITPYIEKYR